MPPRTPRQPTMTRQEADEIVQRIWGSEKQAREQAWRLTRGGYYVSHHTKLLWDPHRNPTLRCVAWVRDPLSFCTIGDVRCRVNTAADALSHLD